MPSDWKPQKRIKDPNAGVEKVSREGACRACGLVGRPTKGDGGVLNRAHLVSKGQRGDDVDANLIPLCGSGTTGCHGAFDGQTPVATEPSLAKGETTEALRRRVKLGLGRDEIEYIVAKRGSLESW